MPHNTSRRRRRLRNIALVGIGLTLLGLLITVLEPTLHYGSLPGVGVMLIGAYAVYCARLYRRHHDWLLEALAPAVCGLAAFLIWMSGLERFLLLGIGLILACVGVAWLKVRGGAMTSRPSDPQMWIRRG